MNEDLFRMEADYFHICLIKILVGLVGPFFHGREPFEHRIRNLQLL